MKTKTVNAIIENIFEPRWWNPSSWVITFLAPIFGIIGGLIAGSFIGLFTGFKIGLESSLENVDKILRKL